MALLSVTPIKIFNKMRPLIFLSKNYAGIKLIIFNIRVRARALTALAAAANSASNMEMTAVVKELVLPRHITSEDQPMETNGILLCFIQAMNSIAYFFSNIYKFTY